MMLFLSSNFTQYACGDGEADCIIGVIYATTLHTNGSKTLLETAVTTFLTTASDSKGKILYSLYYEQQETARNENGSADSLDLAFNDGILDDVEQEWKAAMGNETNDAEFMQLEERTGMNEDDYNDVGY